MKGTFTSASLLVAALALPLSASAQAPDAPTAEAEPALSLALAGGFGAVAGTLLGGAAGFALVSATGCGHLPCLGHGVVLGAAAGASAATPLGVHLANRRRGSYGWALLASVGVTGLALTLASGTDSALPLYAIPVGQIITSILIERATM